MESYCNIIFLLRRVVYEKEIGSWKEKFRFLLAYLEWTEVRVDTEEVDEFESAEYIRSRKKPFGYKLWVKIGPILPRYSCC